MAWLGHGPVWFRPRSLPAQERSTNSHETERTKPLRVFSWIVLPASYQRATIHQDGHHQSVASRGTQPDPVMTTLCPRSAFRTLAADELRAAISRKPALPTRQNKSSRSIAPSEMDCLNDDISRPLIRSFAPDAAWSPLKCSPVKFVMQLPKRSI